MDWFKKIFGIKEKNKCAKPPLNLGDDATPLVTPHPKADEKKNLVFKRIPNGKYVAKYKDEKICEDELIIIILEIVKGAYKGQEIPIKFSGSQAKNVINQASCYFVSRLSFEGSKLYMTS